MIESVYERIAASPRTAFHIGRGLFIGGMGLIVLGAIGNVVMKATNGPREVAKLPPVKGLANVYPMFPTWFVPESFLGFACAVLLAAAGIALAITAGSVLRQLHPVGRGRARAFR